MCAGAGAGAGGTLSSGRAAGPARPRGRRSARPGTACSAPGAGGLVLKHTTTKHSINGLGKDP